MRTASSGSGYGNFTFYFPSFSNSRPFNDALKKLAVEKSNGKSPKILHAIKGCAWLAGEGPGSYIGVTAKNEMLDTFVRLSKEAGASMGCNPNPESLDEVTLYNDSAETLQILLPSKGNTEVLQENVSQWHWGRELAKKFLKPAN